MPIITSQHSNTIDAYAAHAPERADDYRQLARRHASLLRDAAELRTKALNLDTRDATDEQVEQLRSLRDRADAFTHQADVLAQQMLDVFEGFVAEVESDGERVDG